MKTTFLKTSLLILVSFATFSCVNDDDYAIPNFECNDPNLTANKTVQDVYDMASTTITQFPTNIVNEDILEAYVVSSDRGGNFFKSLSLQTLGTETTPPLGFSIPIDQTSMFTIYEPGRKVYVKLNERYFNITNGSLIIGELFLNSSGNASVGRISPSTYGDIVLRSCQFKDESELVRTLTVNEAILPSTVIESALTLLKPKFTLPLFMANFPNTLNATSAFGKLAISAKLIAIGKCKPTSPASPMAKLGAFDKVIGKPPTNLGGLLCPNVTVPCSK